MESNLPAHGVRISRAVLGTTSAVALVVMVADLAVNGVTQESMVRSVVYIGVVVSTIAQWSNPVRTHLIALFLAAALGILSLTDSMLGTGYSLTDPGTVLAFMVLVTIAFLALRTSTSPVPVIASAVAIATYTILTALLTEMDTSYVIGFLVVGVAGQALVLWIVFQLITTLARASEADAKHARIQRALAECSQALLNRGTPEPLPTALRALLDATEAYYAYIDVNRTDDRGNVTWEIVAEAEGDEYPDRDASFVSGTYDQLEDVQTELEAGNPVEIIVSQLPMPIRHRYQAEGIKAELVAPIRIGERWVGTLGYTDHIREGNWSRIEIQGLMRAAEMVGAYWEREAAREGLMELAQAKDRFIAAVSHELRTPLAAVVGFAGELAGSIESYSTEELSEITRMIYTQSLELTHLVDDLLTSERAASGNLTIRAAEMSLLEECHDLVGSVPLDKHVSIVGEPATAFADPLRTRQIIRNLLTNASRYGGENIVVEISATASVAAVTVKDDGPGVGHLDADRIFEPYYRSQGEGSSPDSVGLGLAVARQLARLMEGDIVYRRSEGWTQFELSLPLSGYEVAPFTPTDQEVPAPTLSNGGLPAESTFDSQAIRS